MGRNISPPLLDTVARRADIIGYLLDEPADKRTLEDKLSVSRTTIDRAVNSLDEQEAIHNNQGKWEVTLLGRLAYREYKQVVTMYNGLSAAQPLLRHLPGCASIDVRVFANADIFLSDRPAPHAPVNQFETLLEDCRQIQGLSPVVLPQYISLFRDYVVGQGVRTNLFFNKDILSYLSDNYSSEMRTAHGSKNITIWNVRKLPSFGFALIDEEVVWLAVYDADGNLKGSIINNSETAISWAEMTIQKYREQADLVSHDAASKQHE